MLTGITFTDEQQLIFDTAMAFAGERVAPGAAARDHEGRFPVELVDEMAALGLLGVKVDADDGGAGADVVSYVLAIYAVSRACASTGVTMAVCNLAADILAHEGNADQKRRFLTPYLEGKLGAGTFCLSEPHCGSDAAALSTTAVDDGDSYVLTGSKQWITNGGHAGLHIVFAKTSPDKKSHGVSCFVVEAGTPGLIVGKAEKKMGLRGSNTVQLTFEDCRVKKANLLGERDRGDRARARRRGTLPREDRRAQGRAAARPRLVRLRGPSLGDQLRRAAAVERMLRAGMERCSCK